MKKDEGGRILGNQKVDGVRVGRLEFALSPTGRMARRMEQGKLKEILERAREEQGGKLNAGRQSWLCVSDADSQNYRPAVLRKTSATIQPVVHHHDCLSPTIMSQRAFRLTETGSGS